MPTVSGVQESLQSMPIVLHKKTKTKSHRFYEVPKVHENLCADGGLAKLLGGYSPPSPSAGAISVCHTNNCTFDSVPNVWNATKSTVI